MMKKILLMFIVVLLCAISTALFWFIPQNNPKIWIFYLSFCGLVILIVLLLLFWYRKNKSSSNKKDQLDKQSLLKIETKIIQHTFKLSVRKIQGFGSNRLTSLYDLPWYILVGGKGDGKSLLLKQNEFEPVLDKSIIDKEGIPYLTFWANDHAIVIEVGHPIFDNENVNKDLWKLLCQLLIKYRPRQAINGFISVIGCDRLIDGDKNDRKKLAALIQETALSLKNSIELNLPIYTLFSKADRIADFVSFFENYSSTEVENPFGIAFEIEDSQRFNSEHFVKEVEQLLKELSSLQFERFRSINANQSGSVIALPYQLRIIFERINELLIEMNKENRIGQRIWLRGAYLFSCSQKGFEFDLLAQIVADKGEFNLRRVNDQHPSRRDFFSSRIFDQIVLPEQYLAGLNEFRHVGYVAWRSTILVVFFAAISAIGALMKNNWEKDEDWRATAITQLKLYNGEINRLQGQHLNLSQMVSIINELRNVALDGIAPKPWYQRISYKQTETANYVYGTYVDQLNVILLPLVAELISNDLSSYVKVGDPSKIFEILRFYKMLFDRQNLNIEEMQNYLFDILRDQDGISQQTMTTLTEMIGDLLESNYQGDIKPNNELIAAASNSLDGLSPERLIYARIRSLPQYRNQVDIRRQLGDRFDSLFEFSVQFRGYLIPEIFTKQGYSNINLTDASELLRQQLTEFKFVQGKSENVTIGEITELSRQIQRLYFADYIYFWKNLISNINIRNFNTTAQLARALRSARESASNPIVDVLGAIVLNTTLAVDEQPDLKKNRTIASQLGATTVAKSLSRAERINRAVGGNLLTLQPSFVVNQAFIDYSSYVSDVADAGNAVPLDLLINQFDVLNSYFETALTNPEPAKVIYQYAVEHANGSLDAITSFKEQATKAPEHISGWIQNIANQSWSKVIAGSMTQINQLWDENVYQFYSQAIQGRFPFSLTGRGEVALNDLEDFFKPQGRIDTFIQETLTPFATWDNGQLRLKQINGYRLPISELARIKFRQTKQLSQLFFGTSGQALGMQINFRPRTLSENATQFQLRGAENLLTYRHGPRVWSSINWPLTDVEGFINASFYQGQNRIANKSYTGQWALFKMMFEGKTSPTAARLMRILTYQLEGNYVSFDYSLSGSNQVIDKKLFTQYSIPRRL